MCNELDNTLYRVAEDVLASLAFMLPMLPEEVSDRADESNSPTWAASVAFTGHADGNVMLVICDEMLRHLAANMLGLPEEAPEASETQQHDALRELVNVICGNLLTEIWSPEETFTMSPPRLLGQDVCLESACEHPPAGRARLEVIEGRADVALFVDDRPALGESAPASAALGQPAQGR